MQIHSDQVSTFIQLAITPAFLLMGTGMQLRVLTNRLARVVDRRLVLEDRPEQDDAPGRQRTEAELAMLHRRTQAIHRGISLAAGCALLVCVVMITLFVDGMLGLGLARAAGGLFTLSMLALIGSFICFLHEIRLASEWLAMTMGRSAAGSPPG